MTTAPNQLRISEIRGFKLLGELGQGGMGKVFKAQQQSLDRPVALKILKPELLKDPEFVLRMDREAKAAALFQHPNIVAVIDRGHDPISGLHFIAFEFLAGGTLEDMLRKSGRLAAPQAVRVMRGVVEALCFAESKGLVHRDIKPENIMFDAQGTPKLADLGLARRYDDASAPTVTQTGVVLGTPLYMAPEQALGQGDLDIRADIYALGLCLWRCVTGLTPYDEDRSATSLQILSRHINQDLPEARLRNPEVPAPVSQLISWMCARDRDGRYRSARALLRDMDRVLTGQAPLGPDGDAGAVTAMHGAPPPAAAGQVAHSGATTALTEQMPAPAATPAEPAAEEEWQSPQSSAARKRGVSSARNRTVANPTSSAARRAAAVGSSRRTRLGTSVQAGSGGEESGPPLFFLLAVGVTVLCVGLTLVMAMRRNPASAGEPSPSASPSASPSLAVVPSPSATAEAPRPIPSGSEAPAGDGGDGRMMRLARAGALARAIEDFTERSLRDVDAAAGTLEPLRREFSADAPYWNEEDRRELESFFAGGQAFVTALGSRPVPQPELQRAGETLREFVQSHLTREDGERLRLIDLLRRGEPADPERPYVVSLRKMARSWSILVGVADELATAVLQERGSNRLTDNLEGLVPMARETRQALESGFREAERLAEEGPASRLQPQVLNGLEQVSSAAVARFLREEFQACRDLLQFSQSVLGAGPAWFKVNMDVLERSSAGGGSALPTKRRADALVGYLSRRITRLGSSSPATPGLTLLVRPEGDASLGLDLGVAKLSFSRGQVRVEGRSGAYEYSLPSMPGQALILLEILPAQVLCRILDPGEEARPMDLKIPVEGLNRPAMVSLGHALRCEVFLLRSEQQVIEVPPHLRPGQGWGQPGPGGQPWQPQPGAEGPPNGSPEPNGGGRRPRPRPGGGAPPPPPRRSAP